MSQAVETAETQGEGRLFQAGQVGTQTVAALHRWRHPGTGSMRHRGCGGRGRRSGMGALPRRLRDRDGDSLLLPRLVTVTPRQPVRRSTPTGPSGIHFLTFTGVLHGHVLGITSASTVLASLRLEHGQGFGWDADNSNLVVMIALGFMLLVALVNFRGVGESVKANIVLTCVELSGLLLVIMVGFYALFAGKHRLSRTMVFDSPSDKSAFLVVTAATCWPLSQWSVSRTRSTWPEETKGPGPQLPQDDDRYCRDDRRHLHPRRPRAVAIVLVGELSATPTPPLVKVGTRRPDQDTAGLHLHVRCCQLGPDQHAHGLPDSLYGWRARRCCRRSWVGSSTRAARPLGPRGSSSRPSLQPGAHHRRHQELRRRHLRAGGTTAPPWGLRHQHRCAQAPQGHHQQTRHFTTPTILPIIGAPTCVFFVTPLTGATPFSTRSPVGRHHASCLADYGPPIAFRQAHVSARPGAVPAVTRPPTDGWFKTAFCVTRKLDSAVAHTA